MNRKTKKPSKVNCGGRIFFEKRGDHPKEYNYNGLKWDMSVDLTSLHISR